MVMNWTKQISLSPPRTETGLGKISELLAGGQVFRPKEKQ